MNAIQEANDKFLNSLSRSTQYNILSANELNLQLQYARIMQLSSRLQLQNTVQLQHVTRPKESIFSCRGMGGFEKEGRHQDNACVYCWRSHDILFANKPKVSYPREVQCLNPFLSIYILCKIILHFVLFSFVFLTIHLSSSFLLLFFPHNHQFLCFDFVS